ncbi:hypothetical protein SLEP1_g14701 [Rubroshorea leprosula]|uniref:Peroxidase n=1 Tax=Rubroshorea leprosula TaxID=152421 RepID=A0AAV5IVJ7_9ROSI|nr:hypothetical protein SLEP1_g14701 [Rubroshorea leprosula]
MAPKNFSSCINSIWILLFVFGVASAQLTPDFYDKTCPGAFAAIDKVVRAAIANESRMGASLLRLQFHDCFVDGCDGSVLLDDTPTMKGEKTAAPNNNSLRGFDVIDRIKAEVESLCPGVVSCADIVIITARDSVVALGGPYWTVLLGRRDSLIANFSGANTDIPAPTLNLSGLITSFANKGLSASDLVTLNGAHTVGEARCINYRNRIYNETNIDPSYAAPLRAICPITGGDNNLAPLDTETPAVFDNDIYKDMMMEKGLLHSDQQFYNGGSTDSQVEGYSKNPEAFAADFGNAMIKMGNISPLTGTSGQIRLNCRKVN